MEPTLVQRFCLDPLTIMIGVAIFILVGFTAGYIVGWFVGRRS